MAIAKQSSKEFGIYILGGDKVFVPSLEPLKGFKMAEANNICNFLNRNVGKVTVKIELSSRVVYPQALTFLVAESLDVNAADIFITKGELP